jgi:hypothetical protein
VADVWSVEVDSMDDSCVVDGIFVVDDMVVVVGADELSDNGVKVDEACWVVVVPTVDSVDDVSVSDVLTPGVAVAADVVLVVNPLVVDWVDDSCVVDDSAVIDALGAVNIGALELDVSGVVVDSKDDGGVGEDIVVVDDVVVVVGADALSGNGVAVDKDCWVVVVPPVDSVDEVPVNVLLTTGVAVVADIVLVDEPLVVASGDVSRIVDDPLEVCG